MTEDRTLPTFLDGQRSQAFALARQSDLLDVYPFDAQHYLVRLRCRGLVKRDDGTIVEAECFDLGIHFPEHYLREADASTLMLLSPLNAFHPNIRGPALCIGRINAGTPLVDLIYRAFDVLTGRNVTFDEKDALNHEACCWARANLHRYPIDDRPLKYRSAPGPEATA